MTFEIFFYVVERIVKWLKREDIKKEKKLLQS